MENRPLTAGVEEGKVDARCQHTDHQDRLPSQNNALSFNRNILRSPMDMDELSCDFGVSTAGAGQEMDDILNSDVLNEDIGYLRLQNDFCSIGNEYLLGDEYDENMGLQSSVAGTLELSSFPCINTTWKADIFRTTEVPECAGHELNMDDCGYGEMALLRPSAEEKLSRSTSSCSLEDVGKFQSISSCSFQDILSDEADVAASPSKDAVNSRKRDANDEFVSSRENGETDGSHYETLTRCSQASGTDEHPIPKRSRKPTQRYIDELPDPVLRQSKKKRIVSSPMPKDYSAEAKTRKKCSTEAKPMKSAAEEFSVKAIQVPFGSLVHAETECPESPKTPAYEPPRLPERGNPVIKLKENAVMTRTQRRRNENTLAIHPKKDQNARVVSQKKRSDDLVASHLKKQSHHAKVQNRSRRNNHAAAVIPIKREKCPEEGNGRRKHHILWTITEVKQLIEGVSEFGVGRWSRIKKLFFSSSAHRTSVDLKDKWRNLLKASGLMEKGNHKVIHHTNSPFLFSCRNSFYHFHPRAGERSSLAWRPLPKSIIRRVCELAAMHPYPKGKKQRTPMIKYVHRRASPDRSTDMTLNDYRRILRSIDGN